uniref:Uncharacterized protein n=1 Tax=Anguilla anguilla TaxID=7936 RepID=A0A0E9VI61_ANGAN
MWKPCTFSPNGAYLLKILFKEFFIC